VILARLTPVTSALPADARVLYDHREEPHWDSCDGRDGTFGWSDVVVQVHFASQVDPQQLRAQVSDDFGALGWSLVADGQWTRSARGTDVDRVLLEQTSYGGADGVDPDETGWTIIAFATPLGTRASGC
jgi:hypothetical protein